MTRHMLLIGTLFLAASLAPSVNAEGFAERRFAAAGEPQAASEAADSDKQECDRARTMYQGMLATGTNSWKGRPRSSLLDDVKSCERTGHVAR